MIKRPIFLTIWLIIMSLELLYGLYSYTFGSGNITNTLPNLSGWIVNLYALGTIVGLISIIMLFYWKKVGFYLLIANALLASFFNLILLGLIGFIATILGIIKLGILYLAMKPVWQSFR